MGGLFPSPTVFPGDGGYPSPTVFPSRRRESRVALSRSENAMGLEATAPPVILGRSPGIQSGGVAAMHFAVIPPPRLPSFQAMGVSIHIANFAEGENAMSLEAPPGDSIFRRKIAIAPRPNPASAHHPVIPGDGGYPSPTVFPGLRPRMTERVLPIADSVSRQGRRPPPHRHSRLRRG